MPYRIYVPPDVLSDVKQLPGHVHQRIKRFVDSLADEMRPSRSIILDFPTKNEADDEDVQFVNTRLNRFNVYHSSTKMVAQRCYAAANSVNLRFVGE